MSLRSRLVLFTLAIVVPAFAAAVWTVARVYASERAALERGVRETTRALSLVVERELDKRETIARLLADSPNLDAAPDLSPAQRRNFYDQAKRATEGLGGWVVLSTPTGQVLNTYLPFDAKPPVPRPGQAPQFGFAASAPRLYPLATGRISGRLAASVQVPVTRGGATPLNVGLTVLPAELQKVVDTQKLPAGWAAAVLDTHGVVVARHPDAARWVGRPATADLRARLAESDEGFFQSVTLEGTPSEAFFSKSSLYGWAFVIGVPQTYFGSNLRRALADTALGALALLLASLFAALWVARQIAYPAQALGAAAREMEGGAAVTTPPRTGVREFDEVGEALARASRRILAARGELEEKVAAAVQDTRRAQDQLAQSQRLEALGQLTGGVAHDFNNLLAVVSNNAWLLRHGETDPARLAPVAAISRAVDAGRKLTGHLLRFARRNAVRPEVIGLADRLPAMTDLLHAALGSSVRITASVAPGTRRVRCDASELDLALLNLAVNSRDAMPAGGEFIVVARNAAADETAGLAAGDYVVIAVSDTGSGIAPELRDRVFEPFVTSKEPGRGTGLGLSQVHGFCSQAGGAVRILATSAAGTTLLLLLPATDEAAAAPADAPPARLVDEDAGTGEAASDAAGHPRRLLLVEDNRELGDATRRLLVLLGFEVTLVDSAEAAMHLLDTGSERFDVVLSDIVMPGGMNGINFARYLKENFPRLPVVLITGYTAQMQQAHQFTVLHKPCEPGELAAALRGAAEKARSG